MSENPKMISVCVNMYIFKYFGKGFYFFVTIRENLLIFQICTKRTFILLFQKYHLGNLISRTERPGQTAYRLESKVLSLNSYHVNAMVSIIAK